MSESVHNHGKNPSNADQDKTVESHRDRLSLQRTVEFSENESLEPDIDLDNESIFQHDRYEDLNLLGIGSTGMVRRVFDKRLKRQAAMKILHQEHVSNPHIVKRFISEAQGTAQLQHPGTVAVYDLDNFEDGRWFFTMQEVQGKTLQDAIENFFSSNRTWRFYDLIDAFHKVCVTIVYAHAKGVLHRDLKPENIMLGPFQEVVILDWGVAKFVRPSNVREARIYTHKSQTMYGSVIGTPAYMAPEQARGELHTAQSDVFSLGTILYEILAGHPPYQGENLSEILEKAKNVSYTILKSQNPKRQYLIDVAEHAMQQDPKSRIESAIELEKLLRSWLEGEQGREAARESILEADVLWLDIIKQNDKRSLYEEKIRDITDLRYKWELEDKLYQLELNIESQYTQYKQLLQKALTHYPSHEDARERLVMRYKSQHQRAEREKNDRGAIASAMQLQIHAEALPANSSAKRSALRYLRGHGTLSLQTNLRDVSVFLSAYVKNGRRLQLESEQHIGRAPLEKYPIAMGSYQIRLTKDGYQDTILPVYVEREQDWSALKPARLFPLGTLSAETIYVSAGSYISGGDPNAVLGWPRKERFIDDFFIRKYPVTNAEYLRFLNDLVKRGDESIAETCLPKQNVLYAQQSQHASGFQRGKDGLYFLGSDKDGDRWHDRWPVIMIDYQTANRYIEWWNEQALGQWRLPKEEEWEKASRGVDGRIYPWGNHFDPNWCCMLNTPRKTPILPANVDDFTVDTSPYGVRSMAGNIMEWTSSEIQQLRREHFRTFAVRGGCWYSPEHLVRLTNRQVLPESAHYSSMGFRMVCDIPPNL